MEPEREKLLHIVLNDSSPEIVRFLIRKYEEYRYEDTLMEAIAKAILKQQQVFLGKLKAINPALGNPALSSTEIRIEVLDEFRRSGKMAAAKVLHNVAHLPLIECKKIVDRWVVEAQRGSAGWRRCAKSWRS